jgi:Uma2 family endonuclease
MAQPATKPATYADLEAVPEHLVAEILFGHLVTHPRPVPRHGGAQGRLGVVLGGPFDLGVGGPGGWFFIPEPELHLGPHVTVPDQAGWHRHRLAGALGNAWIDVPPDWICEFLSPGTEKYDKGDKRRIYGTYGVDHVWYVDPRAKSLEVFRRQGTDWVWVHTYFNDDMVSAPPFDAISFPLSLLWPFDTVA